MGVVAVNRIFAVMDQNPAIVDKPGAKVFRATEGIIKVNNVRFDYIPGFEILHGVILK
ncbi:hypothetical protein AGMMS49532_05030 [Endomicrobiia bacterium]|nr:hypothetical protein AGMMS49532_05030 [Endomicrobiia bacterium]